MSWADRCRILSAGPSLHDVLPYLVPDGETPVYAINRAILTLPWTAHWWVAGDTDLLRQIAQMRPSGPRWGTIAPQRTLEALVDSPLGGCRLTWESLPGYGITWCRKHHAEGFSLSAAYAAAVFHGHDEILLYGHDQTHGPDCAGYHGDHADRSADRWRRQADEWQLLTSAHPLPLTCVRKG